MHGWRATEALSYKKKEKEKIKIKQEKFFRTNLKIKDVNYFTLVHVKLVKFHDPRKFNLANYAKICINENKFTRKLI